MSANQDQGIGDQNPGLRKSLVTGFFSPSVYLPLGLTLEALHAMKVQVYFGSAMRRELWTLAHTHGNLLGILLLVWFAVGERAVAAESTRHSVDRWLRIGAILMPLGFLFGGVLNYEGDPSLGILLVPIGAVALLIALVKAGVAALRSSS